MRKENGTWIEWNVTCISFSDRGESGDFKGQLFWSFCQFCSVKPIHATKHCSIIRQDTSSRRQKDSKFPGNRLSWNVLGGVQLVTATEAPKGVGSGPHISTTHKATLYIYQGIAPQCKFVLDSNLKYYYTYIFCFLILDFAAVRYLYLYRNFWYYYYNKSYY